MLKEFALAAALGLAALGAPAYAQETPKTAEDCLKTAFDLAKSAADNKLSDDKLAKVEDMVTKMEGHCEAKQFAEAATDSKDIRAFIAAK